MPRVTLEPNLEPGHALAREVRLQLFDAVARLRGAEQYAVHAVVVAQHAEHVAAVLGLHRERLVEPRGDAELLELLRARPLAWLVGLALVPVDVDGLVAAHHLIERVARAIRARNEGGEDLDVDHLLDQLALLRVDHVDLHEQRADHLVPHALLLDRESQLRRGEVELLHQLHLLLLHVVELLQAALCVLHALLQVVRLTLVVLQRVARVVVRFL